MRRARWVVLVLLAFVVAPVPIVVTAPPAHACTCAELTSDEIWDEVDVVVRGTITDRRGDPDGNEKLRYEMRVSAVYKGDVTEVITFEAYAETGACGWTADVGAERLLALHHFEGEFTTNVCIMSQVNPIPDDYVGTERSPSPGGEGLPPEVTWTPLWLGLGLGALVLAGLWFALRRPLR